MKKFTFLMLFVFTVFAVSAQQNSRLANDVEQTRNTLKPVIKASDFLLGHNSANNNLKGNDALFLKNATATHKLDSIITWEREPGETEWQYTWKEEFYWDASQQNSTWIEKEWDEESNSLFISAETVTEFNNEGTIEVLYNSYRSKPGDDLVLEGKMKTEYNTSGRLESVQYFTSVDDGESWFLEMEVFYTYNNPGELVEIEYWVLEDDDLLLSMRNSFSYNESGQRTLSQTFYITDVNEILFSETHFEYNNSGQLINEIEWSYSYTTFQLEKSWRTRSEYNASGNISTETYYAWDEASETWMEEDKDEYSYNTIDFSDVLYPFSAYMYDFIGVEMPDFTGKAVAEIDGYIRGDNDWIRVENQIFHYSTVGASNVEMLENNDFAVYPNPATGNVTFSWTGNFQQMMLKVFRVDGAKMFEREISSGQNIQLKNLESGVYLYQLKNGNETLFSGKLVKQ